MAQTSVFRGPNRRIERCAGLTSYILHRTCIVQVFDSGSIVLNSGGWMTPTTKMAMNQVSNQMRLGFRVSQVDGAWFVSHMGRDLPFHDGLILSQSEIETNQEELKCTG